ncbi:DUF551 domain-containing protein [Klebsiella pasteurii]|uniref:DUF551 domain-containing protein n=1 Tax=Klebsiella pasteurii TaxID=2587529 RepID=UPI0035CFC2DC
MAKSTITREQITSWMNDANYALEEPLNADDAAAARAILAMGHELLAAMDQKPALHRYRRKAVEPYGPYPWHYEVFVDYPRPVECIEDEYFYAAPPVVTGFAVDGEPVAWLLSGGGAKNVVCFDSGNAYADPLREVTPLYRHAQPAPVVPNGLRLALSNAGIAAPESDEMLAATCEKHIQALVTWVKDRKPFQSAPVVPSFEEWLSAANRKPLGWVKDAMREAYDACRAAMLQAGNSPVIPDGYRLQPISEYEAMCATVNSDEWPQRWITVSERMPEDRTQVILWDAEIGEVTSGHYSHKTHTFYHCGDAIQNEITHWMPLSAAPQEVKGES